MAKRKVEGPDQPRSWAIALAACIINTLLSGISRATGLFYVSLIETYGVSRLQANLPFTARNIVRNIAGPVVGAIGQRYGPRNVTILGGVLASLGIILCSLAPDVLWITILWGGVHGLGVALANTLFQVIVTQYFLKYRATAAGLALSGACVGSIVFPVLVEYMIIHLGLPGTFLVTGGIIMHVLPASIMLVEPPWVRSRKESKSKEVKNKDTLKTAPVSQQERKTSESVAVINLKKIPSFVGIDVKTLRSEVNTPTSANGIVDGVDNAAFSSSLVNFNDKITDQREEVKIRTFSIGDSSLALPINEELQETSPYKALVKLYRDPMFHMISLSMAAFAMAYDPAITVIVDYLMDKGLSEDVAKYFIIMMAVGDLVGRIGFGWVTDKGYMSHSRFMMMLQVGLGVATLLMPFLYELDSLMAVIVVNGLLAGTTLVMYPLLIGKYLQTVQSMAIGCVSFFTGVLSFGVPPVIGYFRDEIGSYDGMFYITGGLSVVAGLAWLLEPLFLKMRASLKKGKSASIVITS